MLLFRAILLIVLVLAVLFAWRSWRHLPAMASIAAAVAGVCGVMLFRHPALIALGLAIAGSLAWYISRTRR